MFDPDTMSQGLDVPARNLPVPGTPSPQIQKLIGAPFRPDWNVLPKSAQEWQQVVEARAATTLKMLPGLIERMKVKVEKAVIDGVRALMVTPESILPNNRHRVLIHMHGGCYVFNPGDAGLPEAVMMAGLGGFRVISVDYRMPPEARFPAALDDGITLYKHLLRTTDPRRVAIFGTSAGGALTLAIVLRAKQEGIPVPAVIAPGTPMSDVTGVGDTFFTNELVDNVLVSRNGICQAAVQYYAAGHDMKDPFLSPVYGDMAGFPPTILTSGTRDLLLSNTVRVHRKMRQAGVEAYLQIFEGQSHAHYLFDDSAPESREVVAEISEFFDKRMAK
jgi:monoterpene epsilon-lactone hydrolase